MQTDQPNVALVTWKRAEDGDGTILRFLELAGKPEEVTVESPLLNVQSAWRADAMERNKDALTTSPHGFHFSVKPFQMSLCVWRAPPQSNEDQMVCRAGQRTTNDIERWYCTTRDGSAARI